MDKMEFTKSQFHKEVSTMSLDELFVDVDDFTIRFEAWTNQSQVGQKTSKPGPKPSLVASEIMTILVYFHIEDPPIKWIK